MPFILYMSKGWQGTWNQFWLVSQAGFEWALRTMISCWPVTANCHTPATIVVLRGNIGRKMY